MLIAFSGCRRGDSFKNIILFIADGMPVESEVAASRYLYGRDWGLAWHAFPGRAYIATWNVAAYNRNARRQNRPPFSPAVFTPSLGYDARREGRRPFFLQSPTEQDAVPPLRPASESASTATALATGYKTDSGNIAWLPEDLPGGRLTTILEDCRREKNAAVGIVSSVPFNHATSAAFAAHNISRSHYYTGYKDYEGEGLADEIILSVKPDVVIGGGHPALNNPEFDPNKGFISEALMHTLRSSPEYVFVEREEGIEGGQALREAAEEAVARRKKLFGLFGGRDGSFDTQVPENSPGTPRFRREAIENPTFKDTTLAALRLLSQDKDGFFLMAEQGDVDWANHDNDFRRMIGAMADLEEAVRGAIDFVDRPGDEVEWKNTIILVTSDHATGLLRLNPRMPLGIGGLPRQRLRSQEEIEALSISSLPQPPYVSPFDYPDGEVGYGTSGHTNELVSLAVTAPAAGFFEKYEGWWYPGPIIDNTQINAAVRKALRLPAR